MINGYLVRFLISFLLCSISPFIMADTLYHGGLIEAIFLTLQNDKNIAISEQKITENEGNILTNHSIFETTINTSFGHNHINTPKTMTSSPYGETRNMVIPEINTDHTIYSLGVSQKQSFGLIINPVLSIIHTADNFSNQTRPSTGSASINFTLPLLKGWGTTVNTAPEESAKYGYEAAAYNYTHTVANSITNTAIQFWHYIEAKKILEVESTSEKRTESMLNDAKKLANGDKIPASDVAKYEVKLYGQTQSRIAAQQSVIMAKGALFEAINIPNQFNDTNNDDSFPEPEKANLEILSDNKNLSVLLNTTKSRRFDVIASEYETLSAVILSEAANIDNKSKLDLNVAVGYNGTINNKSISQSYLAFDNLASGANVEATINYAIPVTNSANRGHVLQRLSIAKQAKIQQEALINFVTTDAQVQVNNLRAALNELTQARNQFTSQKNIFENEKKKYQASISTVLDLFTQESLLTSTEINLVRAQTNFAQSIVKFRFSTGTLLTHNQEFQSIEKSLFTTLPIPASFVQ